jgi:hypothetical protein
MTKKQQIIDYFVKHPDADVKKVSAKFTAAMPTIYTLRKQAMKAAQEQIATEAAGPQVEAATGDANAVQVGGDHYKSMGVEPWNVVDTWTREQRIGFYRGGALKYIMRMGSKDESPVEIAKGQHYMQKLLEVLREEDDRG